MGVTWDDLTTPARESGYITYVETATRGSETSVAASSGDSQIVVADVSVFIRSDVSGFERPGGSLDIGQQLAPLKYTDAVVNADGKSGTITLASPLGADVDEGVRVDVWARRGPQTYYIATVATVIGQLTARLPGHYIPHLKGGPREDGDQEQVEIERFGSQWVVVDVPLQDPSVNLGFASDDPINPPAVVATFQQKADDVTAAIRPDALGDGAITGNVTVQGTIQSGGGDMGTTGHTRQGLVGRKASGETASALWNSDEQKDRQRGIGELDELAVSGPVFFGGDDVLIGQGGRLKFLKHTIGPTVAPTGDEDWPAVDGDFAGFLAKSRIGWAMVSPTVAFTLARVDLGGSVQTWLVSVNPAESSGALIGVYRLDGPAGVDRISVDYSSLNDQLVTLGTDGTAWLVEYWAMPSGDSAVWSSQWTWTGGEHPRNYQGVTPTLTCTDDTGQDRVILAQTHRGDGTVIYAQYLDGVFDDQGTTTTPLNLGDLAGVAVLTGNTRIVLASSQTAPGNPYRDADGAVAMPLVTLASGIVSPVALPVGESNSMCAGISCLDGDTELNRVWYASRSSNRIIQHSDPNVSGFIWLRTADGDSASGGVTEPGPPVKLTKRPGTRTGVVRSALPKGVDSGLIYAATGNTLPPNANFHAQNEPLTAGPVFCQIFNIGTTGSVPKLPGGSTFPTALESPAVLVSHDDVEVLDVASYTNPTPIGPRLDALEAGGGGGSGDAPFGLIFVDNGLSDGTGSFMLFDDGVVV